MLASLDSMRTGRPARRFKDFTWSKLDSWSRRRVIGKAEVTGGDVNRRFVVTSLKSTGGWHPRGAVKGRAQPSNRPATVAFRICPRTVLLGAIGQGGREHLSRVARPGEFLGYGQLSPQRLMAGALLSISDYVVAQQRRRDMIAAVH